MMLSMSLAIPAVRGSGKFSDSQTFDANIDGWSTWAGTPGTLEWRASDSTSHSPGPYTGVLYMAWDSSNDHRVRRSYTTKPSTSYKATVVLSLEDAGDRVTVAAQQLNTLGYANQTTGLPSDPHTIELTFTTTTGTQGETTHISIQRSSPATQGACFVDSVVLEET